MEYGKVLHRAWQITRQYKVLWVLGFLASLNHGVGGMRSINPLLSMPDWLASRTSMEAAGTITTVAAAVGCGTILIQLALSVASVIARGGLIAGVQQVEDEGSTSIGRAWQVGDKRFWTLVGIGILATMPFIVMALILVVVGVVSGTNLGEWFRTLEWPDTRIESWLGYTGLWYCGATIVAWLVWLIQVYAERTAILKGLGWTKAFKQGWRVFKANIGPTLVFGLIFLVIGTIVDETVATFAQPITKAVTLANVGAWKSVLISAGSLLVIMLGALIGGVVNTFTSVTWTLVYREITAGRRRSRWSELGPQTTLQSATGTDEDAKGHRRREGKRKGHKRHKVARVAVLEAGHWSPLLPLVRSSSGEP